MGRGSGVIARAAEDIGVEFPDMTDLSRFNLQYMRSFAEARPAYKAPPHLSRQAVRSGNS